MRKWKIGLICGTVLGEISPRLIFLLGYNTSWGNSTIPIIFCSFVGFTIGYIIDKCTLKNEEVISSVYKEKIKGFLKPTKKKLVAFIILISILPLLITVSQGLPDKSPIIPLLLRDFIIYVFYIPMFLGSILVGGECCPDCGDVPGSTLVYFHCISGMVVYYALCYLLSCGIITIYNKIRSRK